MPNLIAHYLYTQGGGLSNLYRCDMKDPRDKNPRGHKEGVPSDLICD
nr:MAG TPA: hypothetical protein [Caudoviricetes sp.]